ncbi:unnamed protein product [Rhizophagus irregularis]|nr:unnamed protein product [Rhizophagus irregularis]CAB4418003.1 unnamed protein product [Rhizophagus irregularis]
MARISPNGDLLKVENNDRHIDTTVYRQIAEKKDVWCIIDSVMPKFNHDLIGKFIMVSSLKKQFIERFTKAQKIEIFYMSPWEIGSI